MPFAYTLLRVPANRALRLAAVMSCLLQMALPDPVDMLADYPSSPFGEPDLNAFGPRG